MKIKYNDNEGEVHSIKTISGNTISPNHVQSINDLKNDSHGSKSKSVNKPRYSANKGGNWYGLDDELEKVTKEFDIHKELKKEFDVDDVKGYTKDDQKYYALVYSP